MQSTFGSIRGSSGPGLDWERKIIDHAIAKLRWQRALHEEQRSVLDGKSAASADLLLLRIKAAEAKIELAEYKARERGIRADCKP